MTADPTYKLPVDQAGVQWDDPDYQNPIRRRPETTSLHPRGRQPVVERSPFLRTRHHAGRVTSRLGTAAPDGFYDSPNDPEQSPVSSDFPPVDWTV